MKRIGVRGQLAKRYRRSGPLFATLFIFACLVAAVAMAETLPHCDEVNNAIYHLEQSGEPDSLGFMLQLIGLARTCEANQTDEIQAWLSLKEVWGLDRLGRYGEAEEKAEWFFAHHAKDAPPRYRAGMYVNLFRLRWLRGNLLGAVAAYYKGVPDYSALPEAMQQRNALNLVRVYLEAGERTEARAHLDSVAVQPGTVAATTALALRGMIELADSSFGTALPLLTNAAVTFDSLGLQEQRAGALIEVGRTLDGLGRAREALQAFTKALELTQEHAAPHLTIYGLYRRGSHYIAQGRLEMADADLSQAAALIDSTGLYEHETEVAAARGDLHVMRNDPDRALVHYNHAMSASENRQNIGARRAARRAEMAVMALTLKETTSPAEYVDLIIAVIVIIALIVGFTVRGRDQGEHKRERSNLAMPERRENWTLLFTIRIQCVYTVLIHPREVLTATDDPYLLDLIRHNNVQTLADLYACAYALETQRRDLPPDQWSDDPNNAYSAYFRKYFEEFTGQPLPRTVDRWHMFFMAS
ncbi:hypothetical protein MJD09_00760 [bacterium]|nr:hypothetical protein [bacterium]